MTDARLAVRRVVTGHDEHAKSIILSDGPLPQFSDRAMFAEIWNTEASPARTRKFSSCRVWASSPPSRVGDIADTVAASECYFQGGHRAIHSRPRAWTGPGALARPPRARVVWLERELTDLGWLRALDRSDLSARGLDPERLNFARLELAEVTRAGQYHGVTRKDAPACRRAEWWKQKQRPVQLLCHQRATKVAIAASSRKVCSVCARCRFTGPAGVEVSRYNCAPSLA